VAFLSLLVHPAICQVPARDEPSPQIRKEWALGRHVAQSLEQRDGRIDDPAIIQYLQHIENTVAGAIGAQPLEVRLTRSSDQYASRLPDRVLYISGGLLERVENEAELAGLLAHELAHAQEGKVAAPKGRGVATFRDGCVLASRLTPPGPEEARERERHAATAATGYLKAAGYDPAGVLDLFSKLAYENPVWAKAILPEDLLELRIRMEADAIPPGGYRIESSQFLRTHAMLEVELGHTGAKKPSPSSEPVLSRKH
jgi:hypothetical protein